MAYDVIKTIGGREYRYRVERVRDEATGRTRSRWTYVGRVASERPSRTAAPRRAEARERILDALERLLAGSEYADLTADAIAREAGIAHGTFYRHFRDKRAAFTAAIERLRASREPISSFLDDAVADRSSARAALRRFAEKFLAEPSRHPVLLRAWYAASVRDAEFAAERRERSAAATQRLAEHFARLRERGFATTVDPAGTAAVVFALLEGYYRDGVIDGVPVDAARASAVLDAVDRAVFGSVS